jgi:hypothetical protein
MANDSVSLNVSLPIGCILSRTHRSIDLQNMARGITLNRKTIVAQSAGLPAHRIAGPPDCRPTGLLPCWITSLDGRLS